MAMVRPAFPRNRILRDGDRPCGVCGSGKADHGQGWRDHAYQTFRGRWKDNRTPAAQWRGVLRELSGLLLGVKARVVGMRWQP